MKIAMLFFYFMFTKFDLLNNYSFLTCFWNKYLHAVLKFSVFFSLGFFGPALCLFGVILAACNSTWSVFFLTLAMGFNGCTYSGYMVTHVDMSPDFAGK